MTRLDFKKHMDRLSAQYGETSYAGERTEMIWETVKDLTVYEWQRVVSNLIANNAYAPMLNKISEIVYPYRSRIANRAEEEIKKAQQNEPLCPKCANIGSFSCKIIDTIYTSTFRCDCRIAELKKELNITKWDERFRQSYEPIFYYDDSSFRSSTDEELKTINSALNVFGKSDHNRNREVKEQVRQAKLDFDF